ncbi:sulfotransferase, partial [Schleiferiaceae bacterium]|nr:sulfotransferase [Schleiferiaceae bacterium]
MANINPPNLFIVGTHKSGTTRLHNLLSLHPMIRSGRVKEPHYYTPLRYGSGLSNFDEYRGLYNVVDGAKYFLDSSPSYFYGGDAIIQQIEKNHGSSAKYLCIIREPVDRLSSYYHQMKIIQPSKYTATLREFFTESVRVKDQVDRDIPVYRGVREGEYVNYLSPWLSLPSNRFKLIFFEDLKNNEAHLLESVFNWLGLDSAISVTTTAS